jgi:peptidoglycan/LPS O-acetylase OafA/YrhL
MSNLKRDYIPALTGVRFLAGTFVFLFHHYPHKQSNSYQVLGLINEMYTGIGLFFVLSGFLICYTYYPDKTVGSADIKTYLVKRFARIYPVFFLVSAIYFLRW